MTELKSWMRDNATLVYFLIACQANVPRTATLELRAGHDLG